MVTLKDDQTAPQVPYPPASPICESVPRRMVQTSQRKRAAMLGHDIRAAISDILGGLALADLSQIDSDSSLQLQRVQSAAEQLSRLTDEALALVTGEDLTEGRSQVTELGPFLARIAARWTAHADERGLGFALELDEDLPAALGTPSLALERILTNLIGNAMKYSPCGTVRLRVHMGAQEALCLRVRDNGPGFSRAALAHLFEFAGRPAGSSQPGTGLGLHIVRELAQRIGGQLQVANAAEGGAEVSLVLPRTSWAPGVEAPEALEDLPDLTGFDALVADDNATNRLLMCQMLETLGAHCTVVKDGQAALDALTTGRFGLALIDIEMPRLSGIDVIRRLRAAESPERPVPVLAVTAFVLYANREQIYAAGADGILAKPILSLDAFGEAIGRVLRKRGVPCRPADAPFDGLHLDRLLALAGPEQGRELLSRMREDFDEVRTGLCDGEARGDRALLRARTHVLISLAGALGNSTLQAQAEELNAAARRSEPAALRPLCHKVTENVGQLCMALRHEYESRYGEAAS